MDKYIWDLISKDKLTASVFINGIIKDSNMTIEDRPLIQHAVEMKSRESLFLLLCMYSDVTCILEMKDWEKVIEEIDPSLVILVQEIALKEKDRNTLVSQRILNGIDKYMLEKDTGLYRDVFFFEDKKSKRHWVALYYFEYIHEDFLFDYVKDSFMCGNDDEKDSAKYALVVSAPTEDQIGEKIPHFHMFFAALLEFNEVPLEDLEKTLKQIEEAEITLVGVHYSTKSSFVQIDIDGTFELDPKFIDSFKRTETRAHAQLTEARNRQEEGGIHENKFTFSQLLSWDDQIHSWVKAFKKTYGCYPNIMLASTATYSRIDLVANARGKNNIKNLQGEKATEFVSMSGFHGDGYALVFCLDESLPIDSIILIYDSDPDGGEPLPEENNKKDKDQKKKVAS